MGSPLFDGVSAGTLDNAIKGIVARTLFTATPWLRVMRTNKDMFRAWTGGASMRVPFDLQPVPGGAFTPGTDTFGLQEVQTFDDMVFGLKFYNAEVAILDTVTDVFNIGPNVIVNILKEKYGSAANVVDARIAADLPNHGQATGTGVTNNRTKNLNGFLEGFSDGYTPGWTGEYFPTYGGQSRNAALTGTVLNSIPYWGGNSDGTAAPISLAVLNRTYHRCKQGKGEGKLLGGKPNYGLCPDYLFGCIAERVFGMQRMDVTAGEAKDPSIGLSGLKFNNAIIFPDSFMPGTQNAIYLQDKVAATACTTGTFPLPVSAQTNAVYNNMPTGTPTMHVGETFWWLRSDVWRFSHPTAGAYAFRPRGMQYAYDGNIKADIVQAAILMYCQVPGSNQLSYGYSS
jgi:hypothetical protein